MRLDKKRKSRFNKYKLLVAAIAIIFALILVINVFNVFDDPLAFNIQAKKVSEINVLIFNGDGVMEDSIEGIEDSLNDTNNQNLTPYYHFNYATSNVINSKTLSAYDVLIIPGGDASTYIDSDELDSGAIKHFVSGGKGYLGICAGAYVASNRVDGYYSGWGIASDVNAKNQEYEGLVPISLTSYGTKELNQSSFQNLHLENGPAMYTTNSQIVMATYADNETGYQDYVAILGETYGNGRILLSSVHPEIDPQNPQILANMILWTIKKI
jgi:glutamine amidotransferase-like uncharacterized protein